MKKLKFFMSLLKERDWLEEMATKGWLLKDMTLGVLYHFEEIEPTEKVYEIERFTVLGKPKKEMLTARKTALDIAKQAGWEVVTHDESMNYYFVKDKEGDESDEFYDDDELRRERAEKFRSGYCQEALLIQLKTIFFVTLFFLFYYTVVSFVGKGIAPIAWIYIIFILLDIPYAIMLLICGQRWYEELCLSREEWEHKKCFGVKKKFKKTGKLLEYLNEQAKQGLILSDHKDGTYLFEETSGLYQYEIDTKQALKKRLKAQGKKYQDEKKDWTMQGLKWYEMSVADAQSRGFELVCVVNPDTLVYKRASSEGEEAVLLNPNYDEYMGWNQKFFNKGWIWLGIIIICFFIGYFMGRIAAGIIL